MIYLKSLFLNRLLFQLSAFSNGDNNNDNCVTNFVFQGGMRAVIWTDVFQFGIMMVGLGAILIKVGSIVS